jgi:hypothetical protein
MPNAQTRSLDFAPVSGAPSMLRRIAAGYLMVNGALGLVVTIGGGITAALGSGPFDGGLLPVLGFAISAAVALAFLWCGRQIWRGDRRGVHVALALVLLPPVVSVVQGFAVSPWEITWTALGVIVLVLVGRDIVRQPAPLR